MRENEKQEMERQIAIANARADYFASLLKAMMESVRQSQFIARRDQVMKAAATYELRVTSDRQALTLDERVRFATWGDLVIVQLSVLPQNDNNKPGSAPASTAQTYANETANDCKPTEAP